MKIKTPLIMLIGLILLTGCGGPGSKPLTPTQPATAIQISASTETPALSASSQTPPAFTAIPALTASRTSPPASSNICADPQVITLIDSLKSAMLTSNGEILSSLVSPVRGMEVRYVRNGNAITYTQEQAKFLFETTFEANWGPEPGSGIDKVGPFHDVIVPIISLMDEK